AWPTCSASSQVTTRCWSSCPNGPGPRTLPTSCASWRGYEDLSQTAPGGVVGMTKRVVLAYSGGLDTSVAVRWLVDEHGTEVVALAVDVGQGGDLEAVRGRALAAGAVEAVVVDAKAEFADEFVAPAIRANPLYEGRYPLVSSLTRPLIARHLVAAARAHGADGVAHGCT